jgi:hypothetical protein
MRYCTTLFILFALNIFLIGQTWAGQTEGQNLRNGLTLRAVINKSQKPLKFSIITDKEYHNIVRIDVFQDNGKFIQTIDFDAEDPCDTCDFVEFKDLNFDGYKDMLILTGWGSGGRMYELWLFNPRKTLFELSNLKEYLENPTVDTKNKTVISYSPMGCCESEDSYYKIDNCKFYLVKKVTNVVKNDRNVTTVSKRVKGKWKVISKKYGPKLWVQETKE